MNSLQELAQGKGRNNTNEVTKQESSLEVFRKYSDIGFINSFFQTTQFPLFLHNREFRSGVPADKHSHTLRYQNKEVIFRAAAIETENGKTELCFASYVCSQVFHAILEMISDGLIPTKPVSDGGLVIYFKKIDIREYLASKNMAKSGADINRAIQILSLATIEIKQKLKGKNIQLQRATSYLQEPEQISDLNNSNYGFVKARLHPMIAQDIYQGLYRQIDKKFLHNSGKAVLLHDNLLFALRHNYLNSPSSTSRSGKIPAYTIYLSQLYFQCGLNPPEHSSIRTARRTCNDLINLLVESHVIKSSDYASYSVEYLNDTKDQFDMLLVINTSPEWGNDQKRSNAIYKHVCNELNHLYGIENK